MTVELMRILSNERVAEGTYRMELQGDTSSITAPGQFVNFLIDGYYLRRPMGVSDWKDDNLTVYYRVVGGGTARMSEYTEGMLIDTLVGLGNGFDLFVPAVTKAERVVVVGGGLGYSPLFSLSRMLHEKNVNYDLVVGFNEKAFVFEADAFNGYADSIQIITVDGSYGKKGFATDHIDISRYDYYFACGPENMLKAVHILGIEGQLSFEARMGCGFGVCMGCSCKTLTGYKRICVEGPVMYSSEVLFD